jgi:hypothetical protein
MRQQNARCTVVNTQKCMFYFSRSSRQVPTVCDGSLPEKWRESFGNTLRFNACKHLKAKQCETQYLRVPLLKERRLRSVSGQCEYKYVTLIHWTYIFWEENVRIVPCQCSKLRCSSSWSCSRHCVEGGRHVILSTWAARLLPVRSPRSDFTCCFKKHVWLLVGM